MMEVRYPFVTYGPIKKGDRFEIIYLPNSKLGAIVRVLEENEIKKK